MRPDVSLLPECVVRIVPEQLAPEGDTVLEVPFVGVSKRTHLQKEIVSIGSAVLELRELEGRRLAAGNAKAREEVEGVRQEDRAVVPEVVSDKPIAHRRLGRSRL